jgi:glutamate-1-semialdehyde 2,1-aminomutase
MARHTVTAQYNELSTVEALFWAQPAGIAAVIVEPVAGNMNCVPPDTAFLKGLRTLCDRYGALLIFDEVMTGFRVSYGGAQQLYRIKPDMTTLGKIIGGGLPVGAYGGRAEIMNTVAPLGPVYQAGTLSGNPLAMAAGLATLKHLKAHPEIYTRLESLAGVLVEKVSAAAEEAGVKLMANRVRSMFTWFFQSGKVTDWDSAAKSDTAAFGKWHRAMLERGVYLPPSQFEAAFLSAAHTEDDVRVTVEAAREAFKS